MSLASALYSVTKDQGSSFPRQPAKMGASTKTQEEEVVYGVGDCHPQALQCLANPKAFTANLAVLTLLQIAIYTYHFGMLRTLERRFSLSSQQSSGLMSTGDAVQTLMALGLGYFARRAHKPRFISVSMVFLGAGCFLYAVPYFVDGAKGSTGGTPGNVTSLQVCQHDVTPGSMTCGEDATRQVDSNNAAYVMFVIGSILIGAGGSGLVVLGISYIDDNVKKENAAIYIAVATAMYPLGPVLGFLGAALTSSLPENLEDSTLESTDPSFIGAWWLGYAILPGLILAFSIPLFCYPKYLPEYFLQREANIKSATTGLGTAALESETGDAATTPLGALWGEIKVIPRTFVRLLSKAAFVSNAVSVIFLTYLVVGMALNTRYIETFFLQPAFVANIVTAVTASLPGVVGNLVGGVIMMRLRLRLQGSAMMFSLTTLMAVLGMLGLMMVTCPQVHMAGHLTDHGLLDVNLPCLSNCSCPRDLYLPVCGETSAPSGASQKMTFLSPCHAGCQSLNGSSVFTNCSCLSTLEEVTAAGTCQPPCDVSLYIYGAILFTLSLVASVGNVPSYMISIRVVDPDLKSFALGMMTFLVNLLAFIPGPIIYGTLTDQACLVWSETCGETGNCLFYDTNRYRLTMYGFGLATAILGFLFSLITWFIIRRDTANGVYDNDNDPMYSNPVKENEHTSSPEGEVANGTGDLHNGVIFSTRL